MLHIISACIFFRINRLKLAIDEKANQKEINDEMEKILAQLQGQEAETPKSNLDVSTVLYTLPLLPLHLI